MTPTLYVPAMVPAGGADDRDVVAALLAGISPEARSHLLEAFAGWSAS